jgi:pimeloyl-ACP methyl ester carboxylesterase
VYPFPGDTCFVLIHGGAWEGGDKSNFYRSADVFATYHRAACNMNYTVKKKYCGDLNQTEVKSCLDFLSGQFRYKKFVLVGISAGSTIAMDYAYHTGDLRVIGVVCLGTIGDLTKNANSKVLFNAGYAYKDVVASSPINATTFCKTLFVHGNTDDISFPVQSVDMNTKLTASGYESMIIFKNRGHWFDEESLKEVFTFSVFYFQ